MESQHSPVKTRATRHVERSFLRRLRLIVGSLVGLRMRWIMSYDERLAHMLSVAEQAYGPRTNRRTLLPVSFDMGLAQVFYPTPTTIEIRVPAGYKSKPEAACFMLAHECIQLLSLFHVSTHTAPDE